MFECNCGKVYKTKSSFDKHVKLCEYTNLNLEKVYNLGLIINDTNKFLFHVHLTKIRKKAKDESITQEKAKELLTKEIIFKYRKSLWDILTVWNEELLVSEYRVFLKWIFKTYKDISLLSLRNTLTNQKIIYRYNLEHTNDIISKRIEESLLFLHNKNKFSNDFEFIDNIMVGNISMFYVIFNDWLAEHWFNNLDNDLQIELEHLVSIASKIIINRINHKEFDKLQELACSETPIIYSID